MSDIRTEENLVEVVHVHEKPEWDPDETHIGDVWVWQEGGRIQVDIVGPGEEPKVAGRLPDGFGELRAAVDVLPDPRSDPAEHADARAALALIASGAGLSRLEHLTAVGRCVGLSYDELDQVANGGTVKSIDNALQRARDKLRAAA